MRYYLIAGEASGDLHGSNLIRSLQKKDPSAGFRCWGGPLMQEAGAYLVKDYKAINFMGFVEVIKNIRTIYKHLEACKTDLLANRPDALILIDFPGFNFRIAEFAFQHDIPVYYYISPQVWAWKAGRVKKVKKWATKMLTILPFEKAFYAERNVEVEFVGHPLLDALANWNPNPNFLRDHSLGNKPLVCLMPGSRDQEVKKMLPLMVGLPALFPDYQFVIAGVSSVSPEIYSNLLKHSSIKLIEGATYDILNLAKAAVVTSGTATLETALFNVPQVVAYKGNEISYQIGKSLVNVDYISLVNLILGRPSVLELIQGDCTEEKLQQELKRLLQDEKRVMQMKRDYEALHTMLGGAGASDRAAEHIVSL